MIIQIVDYIIGQIIYTATLTMYTPDNAVNFKDGQDPQNKYLETIRNILSQGIYKLRCLFSGGRGQYQI